MAPTVYWGNGHYYEYISTGKYWSDAKTAADAATYQNLAGYLATITNADENSFIYNKSNNFSQITNRAWLGARWDTTSNPNNWKWVDGPETGTVFRQTGVPVPCSLGLND